MWLKRGGGGDSTKDRQAIFDLSPSAVTNGVTSEVISIDEMVEPNGNSAVRSFDINIRKPPITPATPKSGSVTPKSAPATPKSVSLTPRSVASSVGTTSSRLCHYLEDCLGHIAHATEQLESAGHQFSISELDGMFKSVQADLQRVVLRSGSLDEVQLDIIIAELNALLDAADTNLDADTRVQLNGQLSRMSRQVERLETSQRQASTVGSVQRSVSSGPLALTPVREESPRKTDETRQLTAEVQGLHRQTQHVAQQVEQHKSMMAETMRETMRMVMMQGAGDPRFMGFHPNMSMGMGHPHALTTGNDKFFSSGQPITIHNHVGVEQSTEAKATQNMVSHHVSNLINKCLQKLKSASGGPWGLVMAGAAGLLLRDASGRWIFTGAKTLNKQQGRKLKELQIQRKNVAREAQRQLHVCERAFHEAKSQSLRTFRNPMDRITVECAPNYMAFEEAGIE